MSWQEYVDTSLVGSGKVEKAIILGHDGGVWATSAGFSLTKPEIAAVIRGYQQPDSLYSAGLTLAGEKVTFQVERVQFIIQVVLSIAFR